MGFLKVFPKNTTPKIRFWAFSMLPCNLSHPVWCNLSHRLHSPECDKIKKYHIQKTISSNVIKTHSMTFKKAPHKIKILSNTRDFQAWKPTIFKASSPRLYKKRPWEISPKVFQIQLMACRDTIHYFTPFRIFRVAS